MLHWDKMGITFSYSLLSKRNKLWYSWGERSLLLEASWRTTHGVVIRATKFEHEGFMMRLILP